MTPKNIFRKYLGWCPRHEALVRNTSLSDIPISGKLILSTFLATTGLFAIIAAAMIIPQYLNHPPDDLSTTYSNFLVFSSVLRLIGGLAIVGLLIDYLTKGRIVKRHKIEAAFILLLWGGQNITGILLSVWGMNHAQFAQTQAIESIILMLSASTLFIYLSYRLVSNKTILEKKSFLLLSVYFAISAIYPTFWMLLQWRQTAPWTSELALVTELITYVAACYFFARAYLSARSDSNYQLRFPRYIVAILFVYSASQALMGSYDLMNPPAFTYEIFGLTYTHGSAVVLIQSVSLLLASIYLFRNRVNVVPKEL